MIDCFRYQYYNLYISLKHTQILSKIPQVKDFWKIKYFDLAIPFNKDVQRISSISKGCKSLANRNG